MEKKSPYIRNDFTCDEYDHSFIYNVMKGKDIIDSYREVYDQSEFDCSDLYDILSPYVTPIEQVRKGNIELGDYYVYFAMVEDEVIYIGSGRGDRYKHTNSGMSSCWLLNKYYFENRSIITVRVFKGLSKSCSLDFENKLVELIQPRGNRSIGNKGVERMHLRSKYDVALEKIGLELERLSYDYSEDPINGIPKCMSFK